MKKIYVFLIKHNILQIIVIVTAITIIINTIHKSYNDDNESCIISDSVKNIKATIYDDSVKQVCKIRNHTFIYVENCYKNPYKIDTISYMLCQSNINKQKLYSGQIYLVDDIDSSYIASIKPDIYKRCQRCGKFVLFKGETVYLMTIWKNI